MMSRKLLVAAIAICVIAGGIGILLIRQHNPGGITNGTTTQLTVHFNHIDGVRVALYRGTQRALLDPDTEGKPVAIVEDGNSYTLEDWPYVLKVYGPDIAPVNQIIYPQHTNRDVTLSVDKSQSTLDAVARDSSTAIAQTLVAKYPALPSLYTISGIRAYGDGTWVSAKLTYTGTDEWSRDTLHTILRKQSNTWKIVVPPTITVSKTEVPEAPRSVLQAIIPEQISAS